jgi:hypothetical protein
MELLFFSSPLRKERFCLGSVNETYKQKRFNLTTLSEMLFLFPDLQKKRRRKEEHG